MHTEHFHPDIDDDDDAIWFALCYQFHSNEHTQTLTSIQVCNLHVENRNQPNILIQIQLNHSLQSCQLLQQIVI